MALNSKTRLELIDVLCEGPIDGLANRRNSVFLNETKVTGDQQRKNRTVSFIEKKGEKDQGSFGEGSALSDVQTTIVDVNQQVGSNYREEVNDNNRVKESFYGEGQVVREITDVDVDFVQLVFTVPKLYCIAPEGLARGQLFFAQIKLRVSIQDADGGYNKVDIKAEGVSKRNIIKGISTSQYQFKTQPINLRRKKGKALAPYRIKVQKLAFGNTEEDKEKAFEIKRSDLKDLPEKTPLADKRADTIFWTSIVVGKRFKTTYPFTALVHLDIDTEEYNTLPARAYEIRGMKVKIPSSADPREDGSLKYDTSIPFDGSLRTGRDGKPKLFYTTCPVCCFYDLLTNKRYGCGDFIDESNLNWIDLIEISQYCNELVNTPAGDEPRFAINTVLGSQAEAYNVLQDMASVFRGMIFWKSDNVQLAADHGELGQGNVNAIHVFSNSNVVDGSFVYSGSSLKTRSTRVRVRYNDPENFYKSNFIIIEDITLISKYGIQEKSVVAFGCTSKYQAQRMGRWILYSEKLHDETIAFSVGIEGLNVLPGQVFEVSDEMRQTVRIAGRIAGATKSFVNIDQTAVLPSGSNNNLIVTMRDGTLETRAISSISGVRINVTPDFDQDPPDNAAYAIKNDSVVLPKYRCLSVAEGDDGTYGVIGVKHVDGIYNDIDNTGADLDLLAPGSFDGAPAAPVDLKIVFQGIDDGRNTTNRATFSWSRGLTGPVSEFKACQKVGEGNWECTFTENNFINIDSNLETGKLLQCKVQAIGPEPDNKKSEFVQVSRSIAPGGTSDTVDGLATVPLPPDPEGVTIEAVGVDQVSVQWSATASGQNLDNFVAVIRHSGKTDGTGSWPNSTLLRKVQARTTSVVLPLMNGEYLVKFEDSDNRRSANAVSAIINIPEGIPRFNYEVVREDASPGEFSGEKHNVYYASNYDGLIFDGNASFDSIFNMDLFGIGGGGSTLDDLFGTMFTSGEYFFNSVLDLGAKYSVRLERILNARGIYVTDLIDGRTELIDTWSDFDGDIPDDTNVEVYFRKSDSTETDGSIIFEDSGYIELEGDTVTTTVQVADLGAGNKAFRFDGSNINNPQQPLDEGNVYIFDQSHSSNSGFSFRFSETVNGTHNGGSEYTTGVTVVGTPGSVGAYTQINVVNNAPGLFYYCPAQNAMSATVSTNARLCTVRGQACPNVLQQSTLVFDDWIPLENNTYVGRSFQFKAVLSTEHVDQTPLVDQLGVKVQFERRTENSETINSGLSASGKAVTFKNAFYTDNDTKVTVGITTFNMGAGDYYVMSEPSATGFTITFKNGGRVVERNFQYTAIGFGNQQS